MIFSLIICTYKRPLPLLKLLRSLKEQTFYPNEVLVIDGSSDNDTMRMLCENNFEKLKYYQVEPEFRGLTRQRNYGIAQVAKDIEVICFLDDDTVLSPTYFEEILKTYEKYPTALGVGGYINNEVKWEFVGDDYHPKINEFYFDGWKRKDGSRFVLRKRLGLDSDRQPACLPDFSHGRSVGFLPPSGKTYQVEQFMGGVSSFKVEVLQKHKFSTYFEGYGLYEDADFTLRMSKIGDLYVNTAAQLGHFHDVAGRPNKYEYGKMVVRNGWYVWRVKYPNPSFKSKFKWHIITLLLILIRFSNIFTVNNKKEALTESCGRMFAWFQLLTNKPKIIL